MQINKSMIIFVKNKNAKFRLYCFPFAGGAASAFRNIALKLQPEIEVVSAQMPGHENRISEPLVQDIHSLVIEFSDAIIEENIKSFAFWGHSLGGLVAALVTRRLIEKKYYLPIHLFISSSKAPHFFPEREIIPCSDEELIIKLKKLGGISEEFFLNIDMLKTFFPIIKSDLSLVDKYVYSPAPPFRIPITALGGLYDPEVNKNHICGWESYTESNFDYFFYDGNHFFIKDYEDDIVLKITEKLLH